MTTATTDRAAALEAILNRWTPVAAEQRKCECLGCQQVRAQGFRCQVCGYSGEPWVWACDCRGGERHAAGANECDTCHGHAGCPVCVDGDVQAAGIAQHLMGIVSDVRAELRREPLT